ncbi:porin [Bartonella refiksaydamii]|uniref:porin n=1 Tax=Bartonella refiksaydamii TaxID=2654951 RepID=UPI0012EC4F81|nr:outer membrane protein [Bartonella refiksaydamii]
MNIKSLMTTSVIALISASAVQAADVIIPRESAPVITAPAFSWTGFYLGAQIGGFSSKVEITDPATKNKLFSKDDTPKPSGFIGGIYAGSNIDLGSGLILGVETDAVWADRGETKTISVLHDHEVEKPNVGGNGVQKPNVEGNEVQKPNVEGNGVQKPNVDGNGVGQALRIRDAAVLASATTKGSFTFKEKWSGATRVRIGFAAADRIMPYIAGGVAYAQMQGISTVSGTDASGKKVSTKEADKTMTMVGFTIGGGVDFAMTDNVLLRAEYRYSDYGKKKFEKDDAEFNYKTNDFRVGVAYKF